jgi:molybdenum cofactor guanylyltransferase
VTRVAGILLAGGASRRFGGEKLAALVDGEPLFHRPLRALAEACDEVVIVLAPGAADLVLPPLGKPARFARDPMPHEGPLVGTRTGLGATEAPLAVIAAADMRGLLADLVWLVAQRTEKSRAPAVVLADADGPRPLPLGVRTEPALAVAERLVREGERRLRALVAALDAETVGPSEWSSVDPGGAWRLDVDEPGDLDR